MAHSFPQQQNQIQKRKPKSYMRVGNNSIITIIMTISVKCPICGKCFSKIIDIEDLEGTVIDSRSMGNEKHYQIPIKLCPHCKNSLKQINIYEYPEGIYTMSVE